MSLCSFLLGASEDTYQIIKNTCLDDFSVLILRFEIRWV